MANCKDPKWVKRFIQLAEMTSTWSHDPSTKVGAIIASESCKITGQGYNGLFSGIDDDILDFITRDKKLMLTAHAEANAFSNRIQLPSNEDQFLFVSKPICLECSKLAVLNGIKGIYCAVTSDLTFNERWRNLDALEVLKMVDIPYYEVSVKDSYKITKIN